MTQERIVLITGASRGIGRAAALAFALEGARIFLNYARNEEAAEETRRLVAEQGGKGVLLPGDVGDEEQVRGMAEEVARQAGRLDVLVNNAGLAVKRTLKEISLSEWEKVLRVNLTGPFLVTREFLDLLHKGEQPTVVNVSSIAGVTGGGVSPDYGAAKGGVNAFTRHLARHTEGIRFNAVAPSVTATDMAQGLGFWAPGREGAIAPESVAEVIHFLASDRARHINGQVVEVTGG